MSIQKLYLPRLLFILTLFLCSLAEIVILELKYNMFSGGFLQQNQLDSAGERSLYLIIFLIFNGFFYGGIYWVWNVIFYKTKVKKSIIAFHYFMSMGIATALVLVIQFELHKYFADAMDITLMKNIAGGDLKTALIYVMDEASLFVIGFLILLVIYYGIYKLSKGILFKHEEENIISKKTHPIMKQIIFGISSVVMLGGGIIIVNKNDHLYFNLMKTNSFNIFVSTMDYLSDVDGDGYGSFKKPWDRSPFNEDISPGALDILSNNIDEDGYFGDFIDYVPLEEYTIKSKDHNRPKHIIIIVMESTRADVVGKMLDNELVMPHLTALAHTGKMIHQAYSHTGFTAPSLASLFSGSIGSFEKEQSLFRILDKQGYDISIFSGQDETWGNNDVKLGSREVATYFYDAQTGADLRVFPSRLPSGIKLSEKTLYNEFKKYSDKANWKKPQFIYFNMQAGHFPYFHKGMTKKFIKDGIPRSEIRVQNKEWINRTYWNAMNFADIYIGKIIEELKEKNIWDDTLLIITGDHGEELFDENHLGHGFFMSDVQTKIPLVLSKKDIIVSQPFGLSDLKNSIIKYVFHTDQNNNTIPNEQKKSVFQMIGVINNPVKISLRYMGNEQIIFDRKNLLVRPLGDEKWIAYEEALKNTKIKRNLKKLIIRWENIRWQSSLINKKPE